MSHGSVDKCEPNMTPMLDLVLQLVMFFMLCANFVMEDVNPTIKLPAALLAKPLDKAEEYVIVLNIDVNGHVLKPKGSNAPKLTNRIQVEQYMKSMMENDNIRKELAKKAGRKEPKGSLVVVRAHEDCRFEQVSEVLNGCRNAGYLDIQLRAIVNASK
jgi:biopolymer transport protein ExbD